MILPIQSQNETNAYREFSNYFNDPVMTKTKDSNDNRFSLYFAKVKCLLSKSSRYVIAITQNDFEINGTDKNLSSINWVCLQMRTMQDGPELEYSCSYLPSKTKFLSTKISREKHEEKSSLYSCAGSNIKVELFHEKIGDHYEFQKDGTLINAIETFQTSISL